MKRFLSKSINRVTLTALFMVLQIGIIAFAAYYLRESFALFYIESIIISIVILVYIINENSNPAYKIAWIVPIMIFPFFGGLLYLTFGRNHVSPRQKKRMSAISANTRKALKSTPSAMERLKQKDSDGAVQAAYLQNVTGMPVFEGNETEFLASGEIMYARMLEELQKAKKYIFLEYFIIEPGVMWDGILEILVQKVSEGVDVRVIYDDVGSIFTLPGNFCRQLAAKGIKCRVFHRFVPVLSGRFNNRDHRKICVIDGVTAFTGGINLADEYINRVERFGHWLDCGTVVHGSAAWGFTVMFLSIWDYVSGSERDYSVYRPDIDFSKQGGGFVVPFGDIPLDNDQVGETAYMNMINRANDYIYICTPYLVPSNEVLIALANAARAGVDVRLITPHIPDKKTIFYLTQSNYQVLVESGVRVYEYTPGFLHSKTAVCDDKYAIVGTINLDFRSLYLHYECAAWMCGTDAVVPMREDFLKTLESCQEITLAWCKSRPWYKKLPASVMKGFAPLA